MTTKKPAPKPVVKPEPEVDAATPIILGNASTQCTTCGNPVTPGALCVVDGTVAA